MTTDQFFRVPFGDGEAIDPVDLTQVGGSLAAIVFDQLLAATLPREALTVFLDSSFDPTTSPYAFALTIAGARPRQGSANNKVLISKGTLLQAVGSVDGLEQHLLAFTFAGTDEVTIANGDPSNPRIDIVQVKLELVSDTPVSRDFQDAITRANTSTTFSSRRRVKATLSVKQGTPAASPTYPSPDSGTVVIAGVVVGTAYAAAGPFGIDDVAGAAAVIHDQRLPVRVRPKTVHPLLFEYPAGYSALLREVIAKDTAGGEDLSVQCPQEGITGRLVSTAIGITDTSSFTSFLVRRNVSNAGGIVNTHLNETAMATLGGSQFSRRSSKNMTFQDLHSPAVGPTVQSNANGMGPPVWTNGRRCPADQNSGASFPIPTDQLYAVFVGPGNGSQFLPMTWWVAEGL